MATKRGHDFDDVPVSNTEKLPQVKELVSLLEFSDKFTSLRLVGQLFAYGTHWVNVKKRDGSRTSFPTACLAFDPETGQRDSTKKCPWCDHEREHPMPKEQSDRKKFFGSSFSTDYYINAISRTLQKRIGDTVDTPTKAEAKAGFKQKDSDTQTPFVVLRLTPSLVRSIKGLKELNVHENPDSGESTAYAVSHPKYGCDVSIKYDKDAAGAAKYPIQIGRAAPLKAVEKKFLQWDLSDLVPSRSYEEELVEYKRWAEKLGLAGKKKSSKDIDDEDEDTGLDDEDEEDEKPVKKNTKPVAKKPAKPKYEDEDEDSEEEADEDEEPVKKPAKKPASKKPSPFEEDEEEEEPAPKKSAKKPAKKVVDEEDEDEEEDEKPVKKAAPKKTTKKVVEEDEDEDSEDDEDEEPAPKKTTKKPAPAKKSTKPKYEEEDDDDEY